MAVDNGEKFVIIENPDVGSFIQFAISGARLRVVGVIMTFYFPPAGYVTALAWQILKPAS